MAETDEVEALRADIEDREHVEANGFDILRRIAVIANSTDDEGVLHDLVLRSLEKRELFGAYIPALDALVRRIGLFPYLAPEDLGSADRIAYEFHRPLNLDEENLVLHSEQGRVYRELLDGRSVILSAPTSFGKSLIIDAVIATGTYHSIAIVVPTIALMDETRRRLSMRFRGRYKVITHPSQRRSVRNIFVLTQERLLELTDDDLTEVDFFVIDEFYKLSPEVDKDRSVLLNQALYRLLKQGCQFYMLGPNIESIPEGFPDRFHCSYIRTDYATVVSVLHRVRVPKTESLAKLAELCQELESPTLIYCSSPPRARLVTRELVNAGVGVAGRGAQSAANWVGSQYDPDWLFVRGLRAGIGMHHGRIPRSLAHYAVRAFNNGDLKFLVCTSTLIEGVNTRAKNVIIFDNKVATQKFDYFTFNNIRGRSGRMRQHYIGDVYIFHDPPDSVLPFVDIPLYTQTSSASDSLLIQLDQDDLEPDARLRIDWINQQHDLDTDTIRANKGIEPVQQLTLAKELRLQARSYHALLSWRRFPTYTQLETACNLIWDHLVTDKRMRAGVSSGKQLAFKINRLRAAGSFDTFLRSELNRAGADPDVAVEEVLDFTRYWATHHFPRFLCALERIQADVFRRLGLTPGTFTAFASSIENLFLDPALAALDEYGLPIQVAQRLRSRIQVAGDLDATLERLRKLDPQTSGLFGFELDMLRDVQEGL